MTEVHLCVVTGQPLANLIPLLQERPDQIVLLHSDDKLADAKAFAKTLEKAGFLKAMICLKSGLPTQSFQEIGLFMLGIIDDIRTQFQNSRLTWNATGGTKQMALAIWSALDQDKDRVIYIDTPKGCLEELIPKPSIHELESLLDPSLYLHALGKIKRCADSDKPLWQEKAQQRRKATYYLGNNAHDLTALIQQFNRQLKADTIESQTISLNRVGAQWKAALQLLVDAKVLDEVDNGSAEYRLCSSDSGRYLTGGWLEEYIWQVAKDAKVDHVEIGLKFGDIAQIAKGQDNEIDAFIVHRNRLLLIECKSGHMGRDDQKDSSIIYKLDSIGTHAGGSQAIRLLLSAQSLEHTTKQGHLVDASARASASDIKTLESGEIKKLGEKIKHWKETGQWSNKL